MEIPFWTIITTLAYNIIANLLTPSIQKYLGSASAQWKEKNATKQRIFENSVKHLVDTPTDLIYLRVRYAERNIIAFMVLFAAIVLTSSNSGFLILFGIVLAIVGNYGLSRSRNMGKLLNAVWKEKNTRYPDINLD